MFQTSCREDFGARGYVDACKALQDLKEEGLVKHVGLVNFDTPHLIEVCWVLRYAGLPEAAVSLEGEIWGLEREKGFQ
jgi:hypothetical protein